MPDQRLRNMSTVTATVDSPQAAHAIDLVNKGLVLAWLWWSLARLTIFPLVGLLVSIKFHYPDFLGETAWLTFGRLRPVHVNGVIFGAFSTTVLAAQGVIAALLIWGFYYLVTYWSTPIIPA